LSYQLKIWPHAALFCDALFAKKCAMAWAGPMPVFFERLVLQKNSGMGELTIQQPVRRASSFLGKTHPKLCTEFFGIHASRWLREPVCLSPAGHPFLIGTRAGTTFLKRFRAPNLQPLKCFVEMTLDAREHRRLISLSSAADRGEGRGEEAPIKNPLSLALSPRPLAGRGNGCLRGRIIFSTKHL